MNDKTTIDESIRGEAAVLQTLMNNGEKVVMRPEHLRYIARQCRLVLAMRGDLPDAKEEGEHEGEADVTLDIEADEELVADSDDMKAVNYRGAIEEMAGPHRPEAEADASDEEFANKVLG